MGDRVVVQFALLFGTTWAVNAAVFTGVLLSVLAAIEDLVRREDRPRERKLAATRRAQVVEALSCLK